MFVKLVDSKKKQHLYPARFSFWYLFFGPIYTLVRKSFPYSILCLVYHLFLVPKSLVIKFFTLFNLDESVINVLAYPHFNFDIFTYLFILIIPRILIAAFIDNYYLNIAINKKNMLPADDASLEKLSKISQKYKDLPVDSSFLEKTTFNLNKEENSNDKKKSYLDLDKTNLLSKDEIKNKELKDSYYQNQLDILYGKYESGFISEEELIEHKKRLFKDWFFCLSVINHNSFIL